MKPVGVGSNGLRRATRAKPGRSTAIDPALARQRADHRIPHAAAAADAVQEHERRPGAVAVEGERHVGGQRTRPERSLHSGQRRRRAPPCRGAIRPLALSNPINAVTDWRNESMATTETATRSDLQELAQRHLWLHFARMGGYGEDHEIPDHRPRRGLLRLGRPRQEVPRRAQRPVLRQHRPRPPRRRPGRRRPGARAGLLHQLVLRAPARDPAGRADRLARARRPQPRLLHQRRLGGRRGRAEARPPVPQAHAARRTRRRSSRARSPTTAPPSAR